MNRSRLVLVLLLAVIAGASASAQAMQNAVVPINGEYWDNAAGGYLVYGGTVVLRWASQPGSDPVGSVAASLVATAWSKNTGASYTLYGYYADIFADMAGAPGTATELARPVIAIGSGARPEFATTISMKLAQLPQEVQHLAFAGR